MDRFPDELILEIINHLVDVDTIHRGLGSFATTCTRHSALAKPALYASFRWGTQPYSSRINWNSRIYGFVASVVRNPTLATLVRSIHIGASGKEHQKGTALEEADLPPLFEEKAQLIIQNFDESTSLSYEHMQIMESKKERWIDALHTLRPWAVLLMLFIKTSTYIRELRLHSLDRQWRQIMDFPTGIPFYIKQFPTGSASAFPFQALERLDLKNMAPDGFIRDILHCPRLKELQLRPRHYETNNAALATAASELPISHSITTLVLARETEGSSFIENLMPQLKNLKILRVERDLIFPFAFQDVPRLRLCLSTHAATLEELKLPYIALMNFPPLEEYLGIPLEGLIALRTLEIPLGMLRKNCGTDTTTVVFEKLPSNLIELEILDADIVQALAFSDHTKLFPESAQSLKLIKMHASEPSVLYNYACNTLQTLGIETIMSKSPVHLELQ